MSPRGRPGKPPGSTRPQPWCPTVSPGPGCGIPLAAHGALPIGAEVQCGYCDHVAPARSFVTEDVYDTVPNEVYVVARVT